MLATAVLLLSGGVGSGAQENVSPSPLELGIEEEVEVQLVLVDFLAVDRKDRTVSDLSVEELYLLVDGRDVEIASLDLDCPGGAVEEPHAARLDSPPETAPTKEPRKIVLVFDYYHMANSAETFDQVFEMLDQWPNGDEQHMVVSLGQVVRVESPFTTDLGEVRWALERMRNDPDLYAGNHSRLTEWPFFERVEVLFDLLERIPGRKTIVLFSGPFPSDGFFHDPAYRKLSAMSTIARTAIYPVDTGGLRTLIDPGNRPLGGPIELRRLANETGGRMTADTNALGLAYARAHRDLGCTYTLGFYDQGPRHDDRRRLTIRPSRDGVRIVYPEFYVVRSEETKKESLFHTASMTPHMFESDDIKTDLLLLGPRSGRRWNALLAVEARLAADEVAEDGEEWLLKGMVRKPNGTVVRSFKRRVPMPAAEPGQESASVVTLFERMTVAPGRYVVSAVLADPEADAPRAATRPAEVAEVPRGALFMVGPILGHRREGGESARGEAIDFEPLLTAEAEQGQPLESLTMICVAGADAPVDVRTIAREVTTWDGDTAQSFDPESALLTGEGGVRCEKLFDEVSTERLEPGRYELTVLTETADLVTGSGSAEFTILPAGAADGQAFKLITAERSDTAERKLRSAADEGYEVLSAGMGRSLTGEPRIVVLMARATAGDPRVEYAVLSSSDDFDDRGSGRSPNDLAAEGYRLRRDGVLARQVADWWLPESDYEEQLVLLMERRAPSQGYSYASLVFSGRERFGRESVERRAEGFTPVGIVNAGRRLRVILERPLGGGAPSPGTHDSRPYDVVVTATPHAATRALEREARNGYRILDAVEQSIHAPPLFLLSAVDGPPEFTRHRFVDKADERLRKDRLEYKLNKRAANGYRVVPGAVTSSRIAVGRPHRGGPPAVYRVVSSRRPPGLPRALEQALEDGYDFLAMMVVADETAVLLERRGG